MADKYTSRWRDSVFLRKQFVDAINFVAGSAAQSFKDAMDDYVFIDHPRHTPRFESPLEAAFWLWWQALCPGDCYFGRILNLRPQADVLGYRLDFSIEPYSERQREGAYWKPIGVELDGHTFHEKTREQVTYRNQRDRDLQQAGWVILHISFDEMNTRGGETVSEVLEIARQQWFAYERRTTTTEAVV